MRLTFRVRRMTYPALRKHLSLIESGRLQVRTIIRSSDGLNSRRTKHGGLSHRIEVAGTVYESKNDARRALGCGQNRILDMLASGEARYV